MQQTQASIEWEKTALDKYTKMVARIPLFHREIARRVAHDKAELNARERGSARVEESDIIQAFLTEVPRAFYSLMIRICDEVGFDYRPYQKTQSGPLKAGKDAG